MAASTWWTRSVSTTRSGRAGAADPAAILVAVLCAGVWPASAVAAPMEVDLELVLAVDESGSMSPDELRLQRSGYVAAFQDPELIAAIDGGELGRIAVIYLEWAGPNDQSAQAPWFVLSNGEDARRFAANLEARPIKPDFNPPPWGGATAISSALLFAAGLIRQNEFAGLREVIDISGDGLNDAGMSVETARDFVVGQNITINGLPIVIGTQPVEVDRYYEECVVGGPGSFSITISSTADFATAIRRKLLREVAGAEARLIPVAFAAPNNCDQGYGVAQEPIPRR